MKFDIRALRGSPRFDSQALSPGQGDRARAENIPDLRAEGSGAMLGNKRRLRAVYTMDTSERSLRESYDRWDDVHPLGNNECSGRVSSCDAIRVTPERSIG